jgi:hypothetical protein
VVQNHRTAVVGGLMSNNDSIQRQGIPWISDIPVLGNIFSSTATDKQKDNLLVFLTPHVIRNKTELRSLALDERARFTNTLGPREMHDMPSTSIHSLYAPSFSVAVPPAADLNMQNHSGVNSPAPGAAPEGDKPTPFNTEEIPAPSSSSHAPSVAPLAASPANTSVSTSSTGASPAIAALSSAAASTAMDPPASDPKSSPATTSSTSP